MTIVLGGWERSGWPCLAEAIVARARAAGYRAMRLDTIPGEHDRAIALYRRMGFREIAAYYETPIPDTLFMELDLQARAAAAN